MLHIKDLFVEAFMNTKIYEMADDRRQFASRIDNILDQVIENLALILHNIETDNRHYIKHWLDELTVHINSLRSRKLKLSKERVFYDVIDAVNLEDISDIKWRIKNKFQKEGFKLDELSYDSYKYIIYFINNKFSKICCSKYYSDNKFQETKEDIVEVLSKRYPDFEEYLNYSY